MSTAFVERAIYEIITKRMNKKQTSCPFPSRGNRMKGSKAKALPWTPQGRSPWNPLSLITISAWAPFHPIAPRSMS